MKQRFFILAALIVTVGMVLADGPVKVGVYYYPWHGPDAGGHGFQTTLRQHLVPAQHPALGLYSNKDPQVIDTHIRQSRRGNIHFWACSWWGPDSFTDQVLRDVILKHPGASALRYAIMYETTGRLGSAQSPNYDRLQSDFAYLKETYFDHPYYLKIKNRPVVFIYLTRVYFRNRGDEALAALRRQFPDVYLVGDDIFGRGYKAADAAQWDAVTAYDVYGQSLRPEGSTRKALDRLQAVMTDAAASARKAGVGLIPFACPGYNDRGIRSGHDAAPRYFVDDPQKKAGELFAAMLREVAVPAADPVADNIVMITSFNEWHEDTQIEPTAGTAPLTSRDDSDTGTEYTQSYLYADYGDLYLDILRNETTAPADPNEPNIETGLSFPRRRGIQTDGTSTLR